MKIIDAGAMVDNIEYEPHHVIATCNPIILLRTLKVHQNMYPKTFMLDVYKYVVQNVSIYMEKQTYITSTDIQIGDFAGRSLRPLFCFITLHQ